MDLLNVLIGSSGLQLLGSIAAGYVLLRLIRWIHRESPLLAWIAAGGLLARASLGVLLFWISYLDLAFLRGLHTSDGFWIVAPDAREYFRRAAWAADVGLASIDPGLASPGYVTLLATWMRLTGISPASGLFLNVALYTVLATVIVYMWKPRGNWRDDLPCIVLLGSFAFAPSLVIHSTQSLKDDMFAFFIAVGSLGVLVTVIPVIYGSHAIRTRWISVLGLGALMLAVYYSAGIRTYYAFFMLVILTGVLLLFVPRLNLREFASTFAVAAIVVALTGVAYARGAGVYDFYLMPFLKGADSEKAESTPAAPGAGGAMAASKEPEPKRTNSWWPTWASTRAILRHIDVARVGFMASGGGTNVAPIERSQPSREQVQEAIKAPQEAAAVGGAPGPPSAGAPSGAPAIPAETAPAASAASAPAVALVKPNDAVSAAGFPAAEPVAAPSVPPVVARPRLQLALLSAQWRTGAKQLLIGLGTLYVPVSLLRGLSIVTFSGGRGLLAITDIDTFFLDLTLLATLFLLYQRWSTARQYLPYVTFLVALSLMSAVLMAYVVTNFGTIFRLRMMTVVPIWMLTMSLTSGRFMLRTSSPDPQRSAA